MVVHRWDVAGFVSWMKILQSQPEKRSSEMVTATKFKSKISKIMKKDQNLKHQLIYLVDDSWPATNFIGFKCSEIMTLIKKALENATFYVYGCNETFLYKIPICAYLCPLCCPFIIMSGSNDPHPWGACWRHINEKNTSLPWGQAPQLQCLTSWSSPSQPFRPSSWLRPQTRWRTLTPSPQVTEHLENGLHWPQ